MKRIAKYLWCVLWHGEHKYRPISPENLIDGSQLGECVRCGHKKVMWFIPDKSLVEELERDIRSMKRAADISE